MVKYCFPIFILFAGCEQATEMTPVSDAKVDLSSDTIRDIAIREVQSVAEDSSVSYQSFDKETTDEYDFSWVPTESDFFSITLETEEIIFSSRKMMPSEISYRTETSITIQGEGPHCDLVNWKHGATSWEQLLLIETNETEESKILRYKFKLHPDQNTNELPFPVSDMSEIKSAVKLSCGEGWANHMSKSKTPYEYPCNVSVSSYIFRVKFGSQKNEEPEYKYLKIPVAMGC